MKFLFEHVIDLKSLISGFLAVFLAALLAFWVEQRKDENISKKLLGVSQTDTCSSWIAVVKAREHLQKENASNNLPYIPAPLTMLNLMQRNGVFIGDFHESTASESVRLLADLDSDYASYVANSNRVTDLWLFRDLASQQNGPIGANFVEEQIQRHKENALKNLISFEDALSRIALVFDLEAARRDGTLSIEDVGKKMAAEEYFVPCPDE